MKSITRVRKEVTTIANRINGKINDLSAAFRRAWQIVKGRLLVSRVSGVTYGTRQRALRKLAQYDRSMVDVALEREAANEHDANAVKVTVSVGGGGVYHLGYLPKDFAAMLAPLMDKGIELAARFRGVTGGTSGSMNCGALVSIEM